MSGSPNVGRLPNDGLPPDRRCEFDLCRLQYRQTKPRSTSVSAHNWMSDVRTPRLTGGASVWRALCENFENTLHFESRAAYGQVDRDEALKLSAKPEQELLSAAFVRQHIVETRAGGPAQIWTR
jgi:hypothetical protein